jgi:hypothetical protein
VLSDAQPRWWLQATLDTATKRVRQSMSRKYDGRRGMAWDIRANLHLACHRSVTVSRTKLSSAMGRLKPHSSESTGEWSEGEM